MNNLKICYNELNVNSSIQVPLSNKSILCTKDIDNLISRNSIFSLKYKLYKGKEASEFAKFIGSVDMKGLSINDLNIFINYFTLSTFIDDSMDDKLSSYTSSDLVLNNNTPISNALSDIIDRIGNRNKNYFMEEVSKYRDQKKSTLEDPIERYISDKTISCTLKLLTELYLCLLNKEIPSSCRNDNNFIQFNNISSLNMIIATDIVTLRKDIKKEKYDDNIVCIHKQKTGSYQTSIENLLDIYNENIHKYNLLKTNLSSYENFNIYASIIETLVGGYIKMGLITSRYN